MRQRTRNASITKRYHTFSIATLIVALTSTALAANAEQPTQKYMDRNVQCMGSKACAAPIDRILPVRISFDGFDEALDRVER